MQAFFNKLLQYLILQAQALDLDVFIVLMQVLSLWAEDDRLYALFCEISG